MGGGASSVTTTAGPLACRERVRADASGRLLAVVREYGPPGTAAPGAGPGRGKRLFDVAFALLGLVVGAPLLVLAAAAIWLEDGRPVFFVHRRQARGGREFGCLKFRTMRRGAARRQAALRARSRADGPQFHLPDDPRLLASGAVLRRWAIDELPQLWNVLRGDMSVVGPRPSPEVENRCCPVWRDARLSVRPGLTGLWQVRRTRRPGRDFQEWIRHDLDYVRRRSWPLDLWVIWRTPGAVLRRKS